MLRTTRAEVLSRAVLFGDNSPETYEKARELLTYCGIEVYADVQNPHAMDDPSDDFEFTYDDPIEEGVTHPTWLLSKSTLIDFVQKSVAPLVLTGRMTANNQIEDWSILENSKFR
jgi:hypothetical protein